MTHRPRIRPEARAELEAAARWYEDQRAGLGEALYDEFLETVSDALGRLTTSVVVGRTANGVAVRRFLLRRFSSYAVYILDAPEGPVVLAFEHGSRLPGAWRDRTA